MTPTLSPEENRLFDERLDKWLEAKPHIYSCMAYHEGQLCCLDNQTSPLGGRIGRDWARIYLAEAIQRERKRLVEEVEKMNVDDERKIWPKEEMELAKTVFGTAETMSMLNSERIGYNRALDEVIKLLVRR